MKKFKLEHCLALRCLSRPKWTVSVRSSSSKKIWEIMLEWSDDPMDYLIDFRCDQKKALNLCDHKRIVRATILVIVKPFCYWGTAKTWECSLNMDISPRWKQFDAWDCTNPQARMQRAGTFHLIWRNGRKLQLQRPRCTWEVSKYK